MINFETSYQIVNLPGTKVCDEKDFRNMTSLICGGSNVMFFRAVMYRELPAVLTMLIYTVQKLTQSCFNLSKNEKF